MKQFIAEITWDECLSSLRAILPAVSNISLDEIYEAAEQLGRHIIWTSVPGWEKLDDLDILRALLGSHPNQSKGCWILIPSMCFYGIHLPFKLTDDCVESFIGEFLNKYGESFFNGDTIILLPEYSAVYMFHHNGLGASLVTAQAV